MPGTRHRQLPFFHRRWGGCEHCQHVDLYDVVSRKGSRLRDQACTMCRQPIGRNASTRAAPVRKTALAVERLARKMGAGWAR